MKKHTKKTMTLILLCLLCLPLLSGCGSSSGADEIHIGYFNNVTHAQALYMKNQNLLEQSLGDDTTVTWTAFNAGPAEVEALFSGSVDLGYIGPVPAISANVKSNGDVVILSGATQAGAVLVTKKDSGIQSVSDLSGKTISVPQIGNTQHLCLLHLLAQNGLKTVENGGTVTISAVSNADVANVMNRGDIDAAVVPEPWGSTLLSDGATLLLDHKELFMDGAYDVAVVVVRKEFLEKYPEKVEAFLAQHEAATKAINENPSAALPIINDELTLATGKSLGEEIIAAAFERIGVNTSQNEDALAAFREICIEQGFIQGE